MRIISSLSDNLWSEIVKITEYFNNHTLKYYLSWKTFIKTLTNIKSNLSHLHVYNYRVYSFNKYILRI